MSTSNTRIVIFTGSELRHSFFRKFMALQDDIHVLKTFCEDQKNSIHDIVAKRSGSPDIETQHLETRTQSERDFFSLFDAHAPDRSNPVFIERGTVSEPGIYEQVKALQPDVLVAYGCSLVKGALLENYKGRFLNVHLGLSPYYRGSGTNFWALVNNEPEYYGATFMHMDEGIDTGAIIHQIRPRVFMGDGPHQIGNRLIHDMAHVYVTIVRHHQQLGRSPVVPSGMAERYFYKKADYNAEAVERLYANFKNGLVENYIQNMQVRDSTVPIVQNPLFFKGEQGYMKAS